MTENIIKSTLTGASLAFALVAANPTFAKAPAPFISKARQESIDLCLQKLDAFIEALDTRKKGNNLEPYYFNNDENMAAIKTAIQSGKFDADVAQMTPLSMVNTAAAYMITANREYHCALLADENGDIGGTMEADAILKLYEDFVEALVDSNNEMMDIARKLKAEGDKLIANGVEPVKPSASVFLFK